MTVRIKYLITFEKHNIIVIKIKITKYSQDKTVVTWLKLAAVIYRSNDKYLMFYMELIALLYQGKLNF